MDTWVRDRRDRFASRAHLVHLRPFSNGSATCPRPGFREPFLPRTLIRQHQYRQSQPVRSIRSQGRWANRELVHSHKAHSGCCNQHQTLNVEIRGTSADHPRHQHLSEGTCCTESCPLPLSYSTPQQHLRIRFSALVCPILPTLETHHKFTTNPLLRRITCITSQSNPQRPPGTSQASSRPVCGHPHISGRHTRPPPVRLPPPAD
ncbi:hypothetical protein BGZ57DRAFT_894123 [Hyaloscypha finlandica]|nr:hypothetical protein BGZ57DRAFT_894123 [Hyaloscypha finlandica]